MHSFSELQARQQRGAVLVISLILLLVMTILALAVSQTSRMEERMAGNVRDSDLAFQSAEAGARGAERYLDTLIATPDYCSSSPCTAVYEEDTSLLASVSFGDQSDTWWETNGTEYGDSGTQNVDGVHEDPHYIVEKLQFVPDSLTQGGQSGPPTGKTYFRISSRGVGGTESAQAVVQSIYTRHLGP